jgi:hypothetical protein
MSLLKSGLQSSIVISGVPTKNYRLPSEWIQPNTTVVNVASFKNVDEETLLKIPGVVYVPMVGKVTVAMLERNLMRLYDQFHSPQHPKEMDSNMMVLQQQSAWALRLQAYSAAVLTLILAIQLIKS